MAAVGFQDIGFQHRVVGNALYPDTMIGKYMAVVFDVLSDFLAIRVFQPGSQFLKYQVTRQLLCP